MTDRTGTCPICNGETKCWSDGGGYNFTTETTEECVSGCWRHDWVTGVDTEYWFESETVVNGVGFPGELTTDRQIRISRAKARAQWSIKAMFTLPLAYLPKRYSQSIPIPF